jgi:hypothetical protein
LLVLAAPAASRAAVVDALPRDAAGQPLSFKTGQVIAISEMLADPSTLFFEAATGSRYGHIGMIAQTPAGPVVYHASPPAVQVTPLADFLRRARVNDSERPQFTLLEPVQPLTEQESRDLAAVMADMAARKVPFNYSMAMNRDSVNCSEFSRRVYEAIGRSGLGEINKIEPGNFEAFNGMLARLWRVSRPPVGSSGVSPFSVVSSPLLKVVHAELPVGRILSDAEIFQAWKSGGGLEKVSRATRIPMSALEAMGAQASAVPHREYPPKWRQETGEKPR